MAFLAEVVQWIAGVTAVVNGTPRTAESVNAGLTDLANRTRWLKDRFYDLLVGEPLTVSAVDTGADELTVTSHGIPANTAIQIFAANGGSLPGGLSEGVPYWVGVVDANTIQLYTGAGPAGLVNLTPGFVGDVYVQIIPDWLSVLLLADATYGTGKLTDLIVFLAGSQTIPGAKTFDDLTMSGTNSVKFASRSITRAFQPIWVNTTANTAYKSPLPSIPTANGVLALLDLPHGQVLTGVTITINPDDVGVLPGAMPTLDIGYIDVTSGTTTAVGGTATDSSVDAAAYSAVHDIAATGLGHTIDRTTRQYYALFTTATGNPITIVGLRATATVTSDKVWS